MFSILPLLLGLLGSASAEPRFTASVPASGDEAFPTNGSLWIYGRELQDWPRQAALPTGFGEEDSLAPWEKNPELNDLWREPRRVRWREDALRARLKKLVAPGEGIAIVESAEGVGIPLSTKMFPVSYRPPMTPGEAQEHAKARAAKNVFELLIIKPEQPLKANTDYALIANGDLVTFSTGAGPDEEAPAWEGILEIRHEGEHNTVYEAHPVEDNSPYPVRIEIYRGKRTNVKLRQFALVGDAFQTGRLSPFNQSCVHAKAIDVAGNETDMLPCFEYPPLPESEEPTSKSGCSSTQTPTRGPWLFGLLILLRGRRSRRQGLQIHPQDSFQGH
jgi:MYXO-CTERM domain-containing protein